MSPPSDVLIVAYFYIPDFMVSASCSSLVASFVLKDLKTDFEGTLLRTSLATSLKQLPTIALPGMLQGNSLGLSEGLKPVLINPVQTADLITPPGSQLPSRLNVQNDFPCCFQKAVSCICSSRMVAIRVKALKNLTLKRSVCLYRCQYSQASLKKAAGESIYHLRSQIQGVANYLFLQRSTGILIINVSEMSFRQEGRSVFEAQYFLKAFVYPSTIINSACVLSRPRVNPGIQVQLLGGIRMYGINWLVESRSHMASISPVMIYVDSLPLVRSKC